MDALNLQQELPEGWVEEIVGGEEVKLAVETDLQNDGRFGSEWLIATDRRVMVVTPNGGCPEIRLDLPLPDLERAEAENFVGNGYFFLKTPRERLPALRFSRSKSAAFLAAARELTRLARNGQEPDGSAPEGRPRGFPQRPGGLWGGPKRCPQCHQIVPHWSSVCPECLKKRQLLGRLLTYALPFWPWALLGLVLMLLMTAVDLIPPYLSKVMVDDVIGARNFSLLKWVALGILGINAVSSALGGLRGYLMTWLGQEITLNIRQQVYEHLQRLGLRYYDEQQTGQIMSRVTHDTGNLQDFLTEGLQDLLRDVLTCLIIGFILFSLNWPLALLTLIPVPLLAVGSFYFGRKVHHVYHQRWRKFGALNALLADTIPGVRVVKAFAQEHREISRFEALNRDLIRVLLLATRISSVVFPIMGFLTTLGSVIVWGIGGYWVMQGQHGLTLGSLVAFTAYLWRFYAPIQNLSRMNQRIQWTATAAERVFEVIDQKPDVEDAPDAYDLPPIEGRVTFENVTFSYDGERDVLKNISFEVEPGEMIGLVGPSGAGKTTLINLLCRFYDVKEGAIKIDGHDLRKVTQASLRRQIGIVLQEPYLFHGSIAENIAYGRPEASRAEIIAAARAANAHDFICQLPDGYDTVLGERGLRLSGGERQRLSIARAILKNPRLLIFDEATSSVDTETEAEIREAIDRLVQNRTTFSIAHRFSTLRNAHRLIVLNEGELVEMGTHEELLNKEGGIFARLCRMQRKLSQIVAWQE